ncbi:MAG: tetratricopeptide repeat protein [Casimicrobiaceae bacterium]
MALRPGIWWAGLSIGTRTTIAGAFAVIVAWRILVSASAGLLAPGDVAGVPSIAQSDSAFAQRLAVDPTDVEALMVMARINEHDGDRKRAGDMLRYAMRLAPADRRVLIESAGYFLRAGDWDHALPILQRLVNLYPAEGGEVWPPLLAGLERGRHDKWYREVARGNPPWWPAFFRYACEKSADVGALEGIYLERATAGLLSEDERACLLGREQREGRWTIAHQLWIDSLPLDQRRQIGYVFNGGFEWSLSNVGFDWITPAQEGVVADRQLAVGMVGKRALRVAFADRRYTGPPIYQYLMLPPGRYRLEGKERTDGLDSWLGLQWGLYCTQAAGRDGPQLAHSDRFLGSSDWSAFRVAFVVPAGCPVQQLRLELANPRRDARSPGDVAARMRGTLWFDEIRALAID